MQRLNNKKRKGSEITNKKEVKIIETKQEVIKNKFELNHFYNDIKLLLQKYNENLQRSLNIIPESKYGIPEEYIGKKSAAHALKFYDYQIINEKLKFYRNLKKIKISHVKKIYISSFNEMHLKKLKFDQITYFNYENCYKIRVDTLELFNMSLKIIDFILILKYCKPLELILNQIDISNSDNNFYNNDYILNTVFKHLNLLSFKVTNSFLDLISFKKFILENKIRHFSYKNEFIDIFYASRSPYLKSCTGSNEIMFLEHHFFNEIELLKITSKKELEFFMKKTEKLKYLIIENLEIDSGMINLMVPVKNIVIEHCYFKNMCFYEFIRKLTKKTKLIVFKKTELPLNSKVFLNEENFNCKVIVDGNVFI